MALKVRRGLPYLAAAREYHREDMAIRRRLSVNGGVVARTARELGVSEKRVGRVKRALDAPTVPPSPVYGERSAERAAVRAVLEASGGNVKRAARETGVPETTVRRWRDRWRGESS